MKSPDLFLDPPGFSEPPFIRSVLLRAVLFLAVASVLVGKLTDAQTITTTTVDVGSGNDTGQFASQAIVSGNPAIAYYNADDQNLMFARNSAADGSGTWTVTTVDSTGDVGQYASLAVVNGNPAISYYDATNGILKFARNSATDGSGAWTVRNVFGGNLGQYTSLAVINGNPAISFYDVAGHDLLFARNSAVDGSGTWTLAGVDTTGDVGQYTSLAVINGNPAISYYDVTNHDLKFARNSAIDGSGTWTRATVDSGGDVGQYTSLAIVSSNPTITYFDLNNGALKFARNSAVDGSGTWTISTVDTAGNVGQYSSLRIVSGVPTVSYYDINNGDLKFARNSNTTGTGTWTIATVDSTGNVGLHTSLAIIGGRPAISYYDSTNGDLKFARNSATDGSGTWTPTTVDSGFRSVGQFTSAAIVAGNPAIAFYDVGKHDLKFARNAAADGSGAWTIAAVDSIGDVGQWASLAVVNGNPAISYCDETNGHPKFARNDAADGSGAWTSQTVDSNGNNGCGHSSLADLGGPAISYSSFGGKYADNSAADGSGTWFPNSLPTYGSVNSTSVSSSDGGVAVGTAASIEYLRDSSQWVGTPIDFLQPGHVEEYVSLATDGNLLPAVSYYDETTHVLRFARSSSSNGFSSWTITSVGGIGTELPPLGLIGPTTLRVVLGTPTISYVNFQSGTVNVVRSSNADGSGSWSNTVVDSGQFPSLAVMANGNPCLSYYDPVSGALKFATVTYLADIAVEQPAGTNIFDNGTQVIAVPVGRTWTVQFNIKNIGNANLTGLTITKNGANASDFTVASNPVAPVSGPFGSTAFLLQFAPTTAGTKFAAIHIASNDADENPFDINLTGKALSSSNDTDGDGMNDVAEFDLAALGFDWQVNQTNLVNAYYSSANAAGLFTTSQVQALNMPTPLIVRDSSTGVFKLTIGIQKSTNLINYSPFPFISGQTTINGQGQVEFQFTAPDNAAFYRLEAH